MFQRQVFYLFERVDDVWCYRCTFPTPTTCAVSFRWHTGTDVGLAALAESLRSGDAIERDSCDDRTFLICSSASPFCPDVAGVTS